MPTSGSTFSLLFAVFSLASLPSLAAQSGTTLWTAGDFNGDHRPDVAVLRPAASPGAPAAITTVLSGAAFYSSFDWPGQSASLTTRDVDADHDPDLVLRSAAGRTLRIWLNDGSACFAEVEPAAFAQDLDQQQQIPSHWLTRRIRMAHRGAAGFARVRQSALATAPYQSADTPAPSTNHGPVPSHRTTAAQDRPYQPASPLRGPPAGSFPLR